jgi:chromosome partitioning protein
MRLAKQQKPFSSRRIALVQRKGGVGKTTLAVSLAGEYAKRGAQTLLVDADPQCSACHWAELARLPFAVHQSSLTDVNQAREWANNLRRLLTEVMVIDTAPSDFAVSASVEVADLLVVPCTPSTLDLESTLRTLEIIHAARGQLERPPSVLLVPNRVDMRTLEGRQAFDELESFGEVVAASIGSRTAFVRSSASGQWVSDFDPDGAADLEVRELLRVAEGCLQRAL